MRGQFRTSTVCLPSIPPFEPPLIVSLSAAAYLFFTRYSLEGPSANNQPSAGGNGAHDAAMKSSKQLTYASDRSVTSRKDDSLRYPPPFVPLYQQGATPYRAHLHPGC